MPVILITVDTLRADALSCYGSTTARTPHIDQLASEGFLFEHLAAPMPETRPSHFSLFTSRYPRDHGVLSNALSLPDGELTLAEVYQREGFHTGAFVGVSLLDATSGAQQGFEVLGLPEAGPTRSAEEVVEDALQWVRKLPTGDPFFLWLHVFDAHLPYEPHADDAGGAPPVSWPRLLELARVHDGNIPPSELERARELYRGEVEYIDRWVGHLRTGLEALGSWDEALVVLTADHGECFENGIFFEHSSCLFEGSIRIPLLIRPPAGHLVERSRRTVQAEILDIAPTLLALGGIPLPESFEGKNLLDDPIDLETFAFIQHPLYPEADSRERRRLMSAIQTVAGQPTRPVVSDQELIGLRSPKWKYFWSTGGEELYDLEADPQERENLIDQQPEVAQRLRRATRQWRQDHPMKVIDAGKLNPELRERLEALGYL